MDSKSPKPKSSSLHLNLNLEEINVLSKSLEKGIRKRIYDKEEITALFPIWNKLKGLCESLVRKSEIEEIYKDILED